jgi:nucleotide-binding universal stress UspA family protein
MKILLPLDGSPLCEATVAAVRQLCSHGGPWSVEVIQVLDPMAAFGAVHLLLKQARASDYVRDQASALNKLGIDATSSVDFGPPARQIVQRVLQGGVDYVCMATHGRSGLARAALGSVTDQVLRQSPVPVVIVHPLTCHSVGQVSR